MRVVVQLIGLVNTKCDIRMVCFRNAQVAASLALQLESAYREK